MNYKYDASVKEWYLSLVKEQTPITTYNTTLTYIKRLDEWETRFGKSIVDFALDEVKTMLIGFGFKSEAALYTVLSTLTKYTEFACAKLLKPMGQIQFIDTSEMKNYINLIADENRHITRETLFKSLSTLDTNRTSYDYDMEDNITDVLLLLLIFEGIRGKAYRDLINIRMSDINFIKKRIYVRSTKNFVHIEDDRVWELLKLTQNRKSLMYISKNGEQKIIPLDAQSDLLFVRVTVKSGRPFMDENDKLEHYVALPYTEYSIKIRLKVLTDRIGLPYVTGVPLYISGVAERASIWLKENNKEFERSSVKEYLEISGETVGIEGLLNVIEKLYVF